MSSHHGSVGGGTPTGGGSAGPLQIKTTYTGLGEISFEDPLIDLADLNPGAIRSIRQESQPLGQWNSAVRTNTIPRTIDICNADVFMIPCIQTTFSSTAAFVNYLSTWIDTVDAHTDNPPLWWEIGNEPGGGLSKPSSLTVDEWQAQIRANYLTKMVAASAVLEARSKKLMLTACISGTNSTGGTTPLLQDIDDGLNGSDPDMVHGMAVHAYAQQGQDNPSSAYNLSNVRNSVFGYRNVFNNFGSGSPGPFEGKPIFVTETGIGSTYRANGTNPGGTGAQNQIGGDWAPGQSNFTTGTSAGTANRVIGLTEQANIIKDILDGLTQSRTALNLGAVTIFTHHDYGVPSGEGYRHYGALDRADAKRPFYFTIKNYQRAFGAGTGGPPTNIIPNGGFGFTNADLVKNYEFTGPGLPSGWESDDDHAHFGSFSSSDTQFDSGNVAIVDDSTASGGKAVELTLTNADKSPNGNTGALIHTNTTDVGAPASQAGYIGGYLEFRAKMPTDDAGWIGLWTSGIGHAWAGWAEHDIVETLGDAQTPQAHVHRSQAEGGSGDGGGVAGAGQTIPTAASQYHTYGVHWEPGVRLRFFYDGELVYTFNHTSADYHWVSTHQHEIIIYLIKTNGGTVPGGGLKARVDYVRLWQN